MLMKIRRKESEKCQFVTAVPNAREKMVWSMPMTGPRDPITLPS